MDRNLVQARSLWSHSLFLAAGLLAWANLGNAVGATAETAGTYTWHAELVHFDQSAGTITVKSRFVSNADLDALSDLSEGDRAMLTWSGISWAAGIRRITRETQTEVDRMTMPVEFVAVDDDGQYLSFRVPIPREDVPKIAALQPGEWVTATSPYAPSGWEETVASMRAFTDV